MTVLVAELPRNELRLALVEPSQRSLDIKSTPVASRESVESAVDRFLAEAGRPRILGLAFAAPGNTAGDEIPLTNQGYSLNRDGLRKAAGVARVHVVNDFVAQALGVPLLKASEITAVNRAPAMIDAPIGVIGPTGGLGVSTLVQDALGGWTALSGEGGHADLAATTAREWAVVDVLIKRYGRASQERALSEPGLSDLYQAIHVIDGVAPSTVNWRTVIERAKAGDVRAVEATALFVNWLAAGASDLALTIGGLGGVYLTGALLAALGPLFDANAFKARFLAKGRLRDYVSRVPVWRVAYDDVGLLGLSSLFEDAEQFSRPEFQFEV